MGPESGTYALILHCETAMPVEIGSLGRLQTEPGWYIYIGSAFGPGGVRARCRRHLIGGRPHWHMDYLRPLCCLWGIWYTHDPERREHQWAGLLAGYRGARMPFPRFGSSDCGCESHLLWFRQRPSFQGFSRRARGLFADHRGLHCLTLVADPP